MRIRKHSCAVCGRESEDEYQPCDRCRKLIEHKPFERCQRCGIDLAGSLNLCTSCREMTNTSSLESLHALGDWVSSLREWLSLYKYGGDLRMGYYLADLMGEFVSARWPGIALVPVPPRAIRMRKEGFDPVGSIVRRLGKQGHEICSLLGRRGKDTQKGRSRRDRIAGGALDYRMQSSEDITGSSFVIIDDVTTTGATLETCASVLKEYGAGSIYGLVVCRD